MEIIKRPFEQEPPGTHLRKELLADNLKDVHYPSFWVEYANLFCTYEPKRRQTFVKIIDREALRMDYVNGMKKLIHEMTDKINETVKGAWKVHYIKLGYETDPDNEAELIHALEIEIVEVK